MTQHKGATMRLAGWFNMPCPQPAPRRGRPAATRTLLALLLTLTAGCNLPAQLGWSPDGSRAAYHVGTEAFLVDARGRFRAELGKSVGGFAWSADGWTLYHAALVERKADDTPARQEWFAGPRIEAAPPPAGQESSGAVAVRTWRGGKVKTLFQLPNPVVQMTLSPNGRWLAVLAHRQAAEGDAPDDPADATAGEAQEADEDRNELYAYCIPEDRLYLLAHPMTVACSFTREGALVYVEADSPAGERPAHLPRDGRVVAVMLAESVQAPLHRGRPFDSPGPVLWMRAAGPDLWLLVGERNEQAPDELAHDPPAGAASDENPRAAIEGLDLYHVGAAREEPRLMARNVSPVLAASPDGRRMLFAREDAGGGLQFSLINADGTGEAGLTRSGSGALPLWPSWRTPDEIVLASPEAVDEVRDERGNTTRRYYAVAAHRLTRDGRIASTRTLSRRWPPGRLPYIETRPLRTRRAPSPAPPP